MNSAEIELLINLVKQNPCLYDQSHDNYKQNEFKEAIWIEIANTMNKDLITLKSDWKKLRDCHRDAMKRRIFPQTEKDAKISKKWKYEEQMEFLLTFMTNRRGESYSDPNNTSVSSAFDNTENFSNSNTEAYSTCSEDELISNKMQNTSSYHPLKIENNTNTTVSYTDIDNFTNLLPATQNSNLANEMDLFFSAMCATTKRLPGKYQIVIKRELFNIVSHYEEKAYQDAS